MLKSVTLMNIPEGMKFSFNVLSNEEDKEPSKGFEGVGAGFNDDDECDCEDDEVDYYLIKNVINSDNSDAKKIAVYLKEMTEQKLTKLMKPYCVDSFDFDITEENEDHFIQWIVARTYFSGLENSNRFYLANQVTNTLTIEAIFYNIHIIEGDYEKTNARFERIKHKVTEHVLTLMHLDEFINS